MAEQCRCHRCRRLPRPFEVGDAHEVAVVLHLDYDSAHDVAGALSLRDQAALEIVEAAERWNDMRKAMEA